jgi:hypothetical protein
MIVAVEDVLSEAVVRKLVRTSRPEFAITSVLGLRGKGYLQTKARELNRTALSVPVFMLVDQDSPSVCPSTTIAQWLGGPQNQHLLLRFAVFEVEGWVLADHVNTAKLLGVATHRLPTNPDVVTNAKEHLDPIPVGRRERTRCRRTRGAASRRS